MVGKPNQPVKFEQSPASHLELLQSRMPVARLADIF